MERGTKIKTIIDLYKQGKSKQEIIELGYNKSTVSIQISKYVKNQQSTTDNN